MKLTTKQRGYLQKQHRHRFQKLYKALTLLTINSEFYDGTELTRLEYSIFNEYPVSSILKKSGRRSWVVFAVTQEFTEFVLTHGLLLLESKKKKKEILVVDVSFILKCASTDMLRGLEIIREDSFALPLNELVKRDTDFSVSSIEEEEE